VSDVTRMIRWGGGGTRRTEREGGMCYCKVRTDGYAEHGKGRRQLKIVGVGCKVMNKTGFRLLGNKRYRLLECGLNSFS
jgi:hypothetical protein